MHAQISNFLSASIFLIELDTLIDLMMKIKSTAKINTNANFFLLVGYNDLFAFEKK